jgi:hypothetical protein
VSRRDLQNNTTVKLVPRLVVRDLMHGQQLGRPHVVEDGDRRPQMLLIELMDV